MDSPTGFSDAAWPLLVDCMCDHRRNFFLSANELLLLCELSQQNVAIFGSDRFIAQFMGAVSGHARSSNVMVSLHVGRGSQIRVRSHFQRWMLCTEIEHVVATWKSEKQALQNQLREQSALVSADRDSRQHQDWIEQFILRERACMRAEDLEVRAAMRLSNTQSRSSLTFDNAKVVCRSNSPSLLVSLTCKSNVADPIMRSHFRNKGPKRSVVQPVDKMETGLLDKMPASPQNRLSHR